MGEVILKTNDLTVDFKIKKNVFGKPDRLSAVQNVNIEIRRGEIYGLVGESGCGKTTMGRTILKLHQPSGGQIIFNGEDITNYKN